MEQFQKEAQQLVQSSGLEPRLRYDLMMALDNTTTGLLDAFRMLLTAMEAHTDD